MSAIAERPQVRAVSVPEPAEICSPAETLRDSIL
jgi:hypothetical protein